jgi:hypothetical protein
MRLIYALQCKLSYISAGNGHVIDSYIGRHASKLPKFKGEQYSCFGASKM